MTDCVRNYREPFGLGDAFLCVLETQGLISIRRLIKYLNCGFTLFSTGFNSNYHRQYKIKSLAHDAKAGILVSQHSWCQPQWTIHSESSKDTDVLWEVSMKQLASCFSMGPGMSLFFFRFSGHLKTHRQPEWICRQWKWLWLEQLLLSSMWGP